MRRILGLLLLGVMLGSCTPAHITRIWQIVPSQSADAAVRQDAAAVDEIFQSMNFRGRRVEGHGCLAEGPESLYLISTRYAPQDDARNVSGRLLVRQHAKIIEVEFSAWSEGFRRAELQTIADMDKRLKGIFGSRVTSFDVRKKGFCEE